MDTTGDFCKNGHEWTPENTQRDPQGFRRCAQCGRDRARRHKAKRGAKSRPPQQRAEVEHRAVVGQEGLYEVTADGRVWSVRRSRYMVPSTLKGGHSLIGFSFGGARAATRLLHHLVLEAFVGPRPEGMDGCHNDGNPQNNAVENLRWDTPSSNMQDKRKHGTDFFLNKTHCPSGHPYAGENLRMEKKGRACKTCHRESQRRRRERAYAKRAAVVD